MALLLRRLCALEPALTCDGGEHRRLIENQIRHGVSHAVGFDVQDEPRERENHGGWDEVRRGLWSFTHLRDLRREVLRLLLVLRGLRFCMIGDQLSTSTLTVSRVS